MPPYKISQHNFTEEINNILRKHFGENYNDIFINSPLLIYINSKTKSANRGSKSRSAFANHYARYVLIEDYIKKGFFDKSGRDKSYAKYEGARYTDLLTRQRELPFGAKLQNHALNSRLNEEFHRYFRDLEIEPIVRNLETQRYWIQEKLLLVPVRNKSGEDVYFNIAQAVLEIIDSYIEAKKAAFNSFINTCQRISEVGKSEQEEVIDFIRSLLDPKVDARIFEIVSYAILKIKYKNSIIWIGHTKESVQQEFLTLYKTGRTNANDGGIDFVMRPLGRFFQVTETIDVNKYFLDIDKVNGFPVTFVVKTSEDPSQIMKEIREQALRKYEIEVVVNSYMDAIEEIINVTILMDIFSEIVKNGSVREVMDEIILQSQIEFNYGNRED